MQSLKSTGEGVRTPSGHLTLASHLYFQYNKTTTNVPKYQSRLSLEDEAGTDLVGRAGRSDLVQALGIDSKTEGSTDTGAEGLGVTCIMHVRAGHTYSKFKTNRGQGHRSC